MSQNWPLHQDDYERAKRCDVSLTGKRKRNEEISMQQHPEASTVGVSGAELSLR